MEYFGSGDCPFIVRATGYLRLVMVLRLLQSGVFSQKRIEANQNQSIGSLDRVQSARLHLSIDRALGNSGQPRRDSRP
jgi:hypothetical protein